MEKAKIMLIAIALISITGGSLAFKAQRYTDMNVYCATYINGQSGAITCRATHYKTQIDWTPSTTLPCINWHQIVFTTVPFLTSSYFTTNDCGTARFGTVYSTNIQ